MAIEKQHKTQIPKWLLSADDYTPSADKEAFLRKTIYAILAKLTFLREQPIIKRKSLLSPPAKLALLFLTVILVVSAQKLTFPLLILAINVIFLAFLDGKRIIAILKPAIIATLFATIIILPSIFLGNSRIFYLPCKIFITVSLLAYLTQTMPFYQMSRALRYFHIPNIFILVLDITLRYIVLLGDTTIALLTSMRLRCVGKNNTKYQNLAAILGTTFLKSQEYAKGTYNAMLCRCFTGEYTLQVAYEFNPKQIVYILVACVLINLFLWSEGYFR